LSTSPQNLSEAESAIDISNYGRQSAEIGKEIELKPTERSLVLGLRESAKNENQNIHQKPPGLMRSNSTGCLRRTESSQPSCSRIGMRVTFEDINPNMKMRLTNPNNERNCNPLVSNR
jgi:hypothetical protein